MFEKLVVVDNAGLRPWAIGRLRDLAKEVECYEDMPVDEAETIARIGGADGVLVSYRTPVSRRVIEACPAIRYIGMCCSLYSEESANVDIAAARENGITVLGIRDYGDEGVVEYVISELVRLLHGFGARQWKEEATELTGQRVGIIGLGRTGKMIADAFRFLGAEVAYYGRNRKYEAEKEGIGYYPLDSLLKRSDIVCTCLPRNTFILGTEEFRALGEGKILVNTSVGPTALLPDLVEWLHRDAHNFYLCDGVGMGNYAAALSGIEQVLYTSKVAGHSAQCMERLSQKVLENVQSFLAGK